MGEISVGIDVSKLTLDVAILRTKKVISEFQVSNSEDGYREIERRVRRLKTGEETVHFCCEATGKYSLGIVRFLFKLGETISEVNPSQIHAFAKSQNIRTKTDRVDARVIANYAALMSPKPIRKQNKVQEELRKLTRFREELIGQHARFQGELESYEEAKLQSSLKTIMKVISAEIKEIDCQIKELTRKDEALLKSVQLLESIPGIGRKTAEIMLAELLLESDLERERKYTRKRQVAHAGLAPRLRQSGTSIHVNSGICKTGNARLRKALYMPTLVAIRRNSVIKTFYERLLGNSKCKMVALIASMRKLLCIAIGVLNNRQPFSDTWKSQHPALV